MGEVSSKEVEVDYCEEVSVVMQLHEEKMDWMTVIQLVPGLWR